MFLDFTKKININFLEKKILHNWEFKILKIIKNWNNNKKNFLIKTSGTTSKPKKILVLKKNIINSSYMTKKFFNLKTGNTSLLCLPVNYIAGKMVLIRSIVLNLKLYCILPSSNPLKKINILNNNNNKKFDFVSMIPLQVNNGIDSISNTIKILLIGGGEVSKKLENKLQKHTTKCYSSYATTETLGHIALRRINGYNKTDYFICLPKIKLNINKNKCLKIYSPDLIQKPLQTNDLVKLLSNDKFYWLGRYDNLINSGGIKIIPEQIEKKLKSFLINVNFFIGGVNDNYLGQKAILFIEGIKFENNKMLKFFIINNGIKFIKGYCFINLFLKTKSNKIKRKDTINYFMKKKIKIYNF